MLCSSEFLLTQALLSTASFPLLHRSTPEISGSLDYSSDTTACSDFPTPSIADSDLAILSARCGSPSPSAECWDLSVPIHLASSHAEGLRPRRFPTSLALSIRGLLPSASPNGVGRTDLHISWLSTSPASSPVNASKSSRPSSGPESLACRAFLVIPSSLRLSQKLAIFCDKMRGARVTQTPIDVKILRSVRKDRHTSVFAPGDFANLGSPTAVRKALSRLVKAGKLRRIRQGLYDLPREHPIIGQTAPDVEGTVRALLPAPESCGLQNLSALIKRE